jgi:hypothetical protein
VCERERDVIRGYGVGLGWGGLGGERIDVGGRGRFVSFRGRPLSRMKFIYAI